ncbi:MAG: Ig-like domain-containing protein, partial [Acidobacteria bacterium]|nr:Ig-like domain-containing protein [Acidobacteriota bacterium]
MSRPVINRDQRGVMSVTSQEMRRWGRNLRAVARIWGVAGLLILGWASAATAQDMDPPVIDITESGSALADGALFARSVTPVITVTDASSVTVDMTLDGQSFTSGTAVTGEGSHTLAITATDAADNTASRQLSFEIDLTAPVFGTLAPAEGALLQASEITLNGSVTGAASLTVDGATVSLAGGAFSAGPYALAEGSTAFVLVAADAAGNAATLTRTVVRDSIPPAVQIQLPAAGSVSAQSAVDVSGTVADPHLTGLSVNGVTAAVTGSSFHASGVPLAEGETTLIATATDGAGNSAQSSRTVFLDTTAPTVAVTDPASGTVVPGGTLTISGTAADPHLDRVEVNGVNATRSGEDWTATVPLAAGANVLTARAVDTLGWSATAQVTVIRDTEAPEIHVDQPADGAYLAGDTVVVSGSVADEPGVTVTVNGVAATVTAGSFTATVNLSEGENRLIARALDAVGNQGAHTLLVYRDSVPPSWLSSDPAVGALALGEDAIFELEFSEPLAAASITAPGAWSLATAAATPLAASASLDGEALTLDPDAALPSSTEIHLTLGTALTDRAGNALSNPGTLVFTTRDGDAPAAPQVASVPAYLCATQQLVSGTAEAGARIEVEGGAGSVSARADGGGAFALTVDLLPETANHLELAAVDDAGNRSPATTVDLVVDCTAPRVVSAVRGSNDLTVVFSETIDASTLAGAVTVTGSAGAVSGAITAAGGGAQAIFTPDTTLPAEPLRLEVAEAVEDLAGNALAYPYATILGAAVTPSFVSGRVLDAATGRPLAGASVLVLATDGVAYAEPVPEQTTGEDGRFSLPVPAGSHDLAILRAGYTPALRRVSSQAGLGADVFDPRLEPVAASVSVGTGGGTWNEGGGAMLDLPSGALSASTAVSVTILGGQSLPSPLPYGWAPRGAVWIDLGGAALAAPASLELPVDAADGATVAWARLDEGTLQWQVDAELTVSGGVIVADVDGEGAWAAVSADPSPTAPPVAVVGAVLAGASAGDPQAVTAAALTFDPEVVLPAQTSAVTVDYTETSAVPSGTPLTLEVREELTLLDGTVRRPEPYEADLVLYREDDGGARSRFSLQPSTLAQASPLEVGAEDVEVRRYAGELVAGNVLGSGGGTVTTGDGDRIDVPAGALAEPVPVTLDRRAEGDLPLAVPAGTLFAGALALDLGGRELGVGASLTLELGAAPAGGAEGLLLEAITASGTDAYRPVALLAATATGWTTATPDPMDPDPLPWPEVRHGGLYLFVVLDGAPLAPLGFFHGHVLDPLGAGLEGAVVIADTAPWVQRTGEDGSYVLPAGLGAASLLAVDPSTLDEAGATATLSSAGERVEVDLALALTGPQVVEMVPADGATAVPAGIEPTVRFSEPITAASAAQGIVLLQGGQAVSAAVEVQGSLVRLVPDATLVPGATYEVRVSTAVRDLQGHRVDPAVSAFFTVLEVSSNEGFDLSKIFLLEPDAGGDAQVLGAAGAVPAGSLVFVENTSRLVDTPSQSAGGDGSFVLDIAAGLGDTLLLHVLPDGVNETVLTLTPFLTRDGRGAHAGTGASHFVTFDGIEVEIEAGTFDGPTVVTVVPESPTASAAPVPADFSRLAAFRLDFGDAVPAKGLAISLPVPAGLVGDEALLTLEMVVLDRPYWMVQDLLRRDGDVLTNQPADAVAGLPMGVNEGDRLASLSPLAAAAAWPAGVQALAAPETFRDRRLYLPGVARRGLYTIMQSSGLLDFVTIPAPLGGVEAFFQNLAIDGMAAVIDRQNLLLLAYDAILMVTRRSEAVSIVGRDLHTGYRIFESDFDPPVPGEILELPPSIFPASDPPVPISGEPLTFEVIDLGVLDLRAEETMLLSHGLELIGTAGGATVHGQAREGTEVKVLALDASGSTGTTASAAGTFSVDLPAGGERFLVAVGGVLAIEEPLALGFTRELEDPVVGVEIRDAGNRLVAPDIDRRGGGFGISMRPAGGWPAGTYTLKLLPSLKAKGAADGWGKTLTLKFRVEGSSAVGSFPELASARDVARLGSLLFVAGDTGGLAVVDASDPLALTNYLGPGATFTFPYDDPVRAVAVDPHGRVFVAGGGVDSPGQLKILDALRLEAGNPASLAAAFRGSTLVSDPLGGTGTTLPAGTPRQVAVLSDDDRSAWTHGDAVPAGLTLSESAPPEIAPEIEVTVSGGADTGLAEHPVTLRDLDRGRWQRVDAAADGSFSVTLRITPGDRLEVLRNRRALVYLGILGVGAEVVDANAFYGENDPAGSGSPVESDVLGFYTGAGDPALRVCNQPVPDLGGALIDLGTLADASDPHPLVAAGLLSFSGVVLLESDPVSVGNISFLNEVCAEVNGSRRVVGLEVVEDYPVAVDTDGDHKDDAVEDRDYLLVSHLQAGLLVFDVTNRDDVRSVARIPLPGAPSALALDRRQRRVLVAAGDKLLAIDFDHPGGLGLVDANGDGIDDRVVEQVALGGAFNAPPFLLPELGLAYAGGSGQELTGVAVAPPLLRVVTSDGSRSLSALAPLGVPTGLGTQSPGAPDLPASFRVRAFLPGSLGSEIRLDVVSLGPGGLPIQGAGSGLTGLPKTALDGDDGLVLRRQADDPREDGYDLYVSEEAVALADLRASAAYTRTSRESMLCTRCDRVAEGIGITAREILSGDRIVTRFPEALRTTLTALYGTKRVDASELELASVRWDTSPSVRQEPALSPSLGFGQVPPGLLLHSGEMTRSATDLAVAGRGLDFAFSRTYRSQTLGAGPLGPGWDFAYHQRLRELPDGNVELYDGRGRRELFERVAGEAGATRYTAPTGWFVSLEKSDQGWLLHDSGNNLLRFDTWGRLASLADAFKQDDDTGNEMRFVYDAASNLTRIVDSLGRIYRLSYDDAGRLVELEDFDGRVVTYDYDAIGGQLVAVTLPAVTVGESTFPSGRKTEYGYQAPESGSLALSLASRDNLAKEKDPRPVTWLEVTMTDADSDGRKDEVTAFTWGGDGGSVAYDFTARQATVTNRRGHTSVVEHDTDGHPTSYQDPGTFTWTWTYDAEGLPTLATTPLSRTMAYSYQTDCAGMPLASPSRRGRGNLTHTVTSPEPDNPIGVNGSSPLVTTCAEYDTTTNQPVRTVDARGTVTVIARDRGKPTSITEAFGTALARETTVAYDTAGRPVSVVEPTGRQTSLAYFESGESDGYLRQSVVDPSNLALTTRYETDARGNVTAVIDSRGARHEQVWNEADWRVSATQAASGTSEGASSQPALGYETQWLYDAAGEVVEIQSPYGLTGSAHTRETFTYGPLGEVTQHQREIEPGGALVTESFTYDKNRNLAAHEREEGQLSSYSYSPRDLVTERVMALGEPEQVNETFSYDGEGRQTGRLDPRGKAWQQLYDGFGRVAVSVDPLSHRRVHQYDDGGLPTMAQRLVSMGASEPLAETRWTYDALGRRTKETGKLWDGTTPYGSASNVTTSFVYDGLDGVVSMTDPLGREMTYGYDTAHRLDRSTDPAGNVTDLTLDAAGNATTTTVHEVKPDGGTVDVVSTAVYDALGRPVVVKDGLGNATKTEWDARSQARRVTDPEGYLTSYTYDGLDRQLRVDRPEGISEIATYDDSGRLLTYADALGHTTSYTYDALDRLLSRTYPDSTVHARAYQDDLLSTATDANGSVVSHVYDDAGRLTARNVALAPGVIGPTQETYAYDALDRLTTATSGSVTTTRTYDSLSRLTSETGPGGTVSYTRDLVGNAVEVGYPSGYLVARTPDVLNRLQTVGSKFGETVTPLASYTYRGPGLVAGKELKNGLTGTWTYDATRRPVDNQFRNGSGDLLFGERTSWSQRSMKVATTRDDLGGAGWAMRYDQAGRLGQVLERPDAVAVQANNTLEVLPGTPAQKYSYDFSFDPAQNLIGRTETAQTTATQPTPPQPTGRN